MNQRLEDILSNRGDNYILPFFWQHGEDEAVLREEMEKIAACGIGAVCVEARPHPDFAGPGWWRDMDIILSEARSRNMKVWILDDAHFPTGQANGLIKQKPDRLRKQYVMFSHCDISGPLRQGRMDAASAAKTVKLPFDTGSASIFSREKDEAFDDDALLGVIAYRLMPDDQLEPSSVVNLTDLVSEGELVWDIPAGVWRVFVLYLTRNGGGQTHYINVIDRDSCAVQIEAVYEPHYAHYKHEFGKTIAGFFSDEPLFGNTKGFSFDEIIGKKHMPLPWSADMPVLLEDAVGSDWMTFLPFLWFDATTEVSAHSRYVYMDLVTRLVEQHFSRQLGQWCEARGVEYIGHVIEDNNQHARLGSSLGHFFRGLSGQHMAGIDDIGGQVLPGLENSIRYRKILGPGDGEFFHFALGKLGSSHGHIDPIKKGRTLCEIFGAYGWGEGVRMMKWLTDHFLVRGVNYFVPHAFSPKEFPDPDCPPHFYARGNHPQFRHFASLMRYMNRLCHLFNGGRCIAPAAILYHGEGEWTGHTMLMQKPARVLTENQIDFDFLPADVFAEQARYQTRFEQGKLHVNGNTYHCLIIPGTNYITSATARFIARAADADFPVLFVEQRPVGIADALLLKQKGQPDSLPEQVSRCPAVTLQALPGLLRQLQVGGISLSEPCPQLRAMHYRHEQDGRHEDVYLFFNESLCDTVDVQVSLPAKDHIVLYDAYQNRCFQAEMIQNKSAARHHDSKAKDNMATGRLVLEPYESVVMISRENDDAAMPLKTPLHMLKTIQTVQGPWQISLSKAKQYPEFDNQQTAEHLVDISRQYPDFSGTIRYETAVLLSDDIAKPDAKGAPSAELILDEANEAVEVWVNDQYAGMAICPPYRFNIGGCLKKGENQLRIEVTTTLENAMRNDPSPIAQIFRAGAASFERPSGLTGEVTIRQPASTSDMQFKTGT